MRKVPLLEPTKPSREVLEAFISRHQHLLSLERQSEEEQTRLLNSNCPQKVLEQRGLALGGLGISGISVGLGGKSLVELHRPSAYHVDPNLPPHTFRSGDPVRIEEHAANRGKTKTVSSKKDSGEGDGVDGVVFRVTAEKVTVAVDEKKEVNLPERLRLVKLANSVTFDRMDRTLDHLSKILVPSAETASPVDRSLIDALVGLEAPTWQPNPVAPIINDEKLKIEEGIVWYNQDLNESQKEAIEFCLTANQIACIHGPPGTGKTHTLIELIFQLLSRPASETTSLPPRILVTTPSNLALDNLLLRLHALSLTPPYSDLLPRGSILRLGHPTRVHRDLVGETLDWRASNGDDGVLVRDVRREIEGHLDDLAKKRGEKGALKGKDRGKRWGEVRELRKEYRQREAKVVTNVVKAARVILATCHSAGSRQINNMTFDVCIVDEATQAVEAVCWVPILKSKKLILAGDPQQLPPTIMSKGDKVKVMQLPQPKGAERKEGVERKGDEIEKEEVDEDDLEEKMEKLDFKKHPQLRPPKTLETTLFDRLERLYGAGIKRVLKIQYRMNEKIAEFPSETLYDSELISAPSVAKRNLLDLSTIIETAKDGEDTKEILEPPVVFFDTAGCEFFDRGEGNGDESNGSVSSMIGEGSKSNENEAAIAARWARRLVELGVNPAEIGIVTPYQAQVSLISSMLHSDFPEMTIGSVDGLQGQEREAIILSLVRSNPTGEVGFLGEYRRLNVAMTRARRQLCVIGDSGTVGKGSLYLKKWMNWLENNADVRWAGEEGAM